MSRRLWLIEHAGRGVYLGEIVNPRSGAAMALFRADDDRKAAMTFPTEAAARDEIERIAKVPALLTPVPMRA
jgi:hypothetical protein